MAMTMDMMLEYGLIGLALLAAVCIALAVVTGLDRDRRRRELRLRSVVARSRPRRAVSQGTTGGLMRDMAHSGARGRFLPRMDLLAVRLARAGFLPRPRRYILIAIAVGIGGGLGMFLAGGPLIAVPFAAAGSGLLLPHLFVSSRISRRETQFLTNLPEGIDIVVRGLKAGLPVSESLSAVGREAPEPVGGIFREVADQIRIGRSVEDAIAKVADTMAVPELRFLGITLAIQKETGGNLTEALQNLSDILRKRRQMKLKIRAVSSEARASAYIIGALPFAVSAAIYFVNPDYIQLLFNDPRGIVMVAAGLTSIALGAAVMMKLVRFDI